MGDIFLCLLITIITYSHISECGDLAAHLRNPMENWMGTPVAPPLPTTALNMLITPPRITSHESTHSITLTFDDVITEHSTADFINDHLHYKDPKLNAKLISVIHILSYLTRASSLNFIGESVYHRPEDHLFDHIFTSNTNQYHLSLINVLSTVNRNPITEDPFIKEGFAFLTHSNYSDDESYLLQFDRVIGHSTITVTIWEIINGTLMVNRTILDTSTSLETVAMKISPLFIPQQLVSAECSPSKGRNRVSRLSSEFASNACTVDTDDAMNQRKELKEGAFNILVQQFRRRIHDRKCRNLRLLAQEFSTMCSPAESSLTEDIYNVFSFHLETGSAPYGQTIVMNRDYTLQCIQLQLS